MEPGTREDLYASYGLREPSASPAPGAALFFRRYVLPRLRGLEDQPVLELGAGTGEILRLLGEAGFRRPAGVDVSPAQVEAARRLGRKVELCGGREALAAAPAGSLAAIVALDVFEHVRLEEMLEWLSLAERALRPGGRILARVPNAEGMFGMALRYGDITHVAAFTAGSVRQLCELRGLRVSAVLPCRPPIHGVVSAIRACLWRAVELAWRFASGLESGRTDTIATRNLFFVAERAASGERG